MCILGGSFFAHFCKLYGQSFVAKARLKFIKINDKSLVSALKNKSRIDFYSLCSPPKISV